VNLKQNFDYVAFYFTVENTIKDEAVKGPGVVTALQFGCFFGVSEDGTSDQGFKT